MYDELDDFFKDTGMDEVEQAKFYLSPDELKYFLWEFDRFRKMYLDKEARVR